MIKIGLIREYKKPADKRVALSPDQCVALQTQFPKVKIVVEPSPDRIFTDQNYLDKGIEVLDDMGKCDILLGIKEVPIEKLIPNKTYLFFAHVIKKQPYNQELLKSLLSKNITFIDYETLVNERGNRLLGFGEFAGIVGAYNGLLTYGKKFQLFDLPPAYTLKNYKELVAQAKTIIDFPCKITVTGSGRVGQGALRFLTEVGCQQVSPEVFIKGDFNIIQPPVFTHLLSHDHYARITDGGFDLQEFFKHPTRYQSTFGKFIPQTDLLINGIFWNENIPRLFEMQDINNLDFAIKVIADVSCDVDGSVPITERATSIHDPVFGWDKLFNRSCEPFLPQTIDVMAVTNLPTELPFDASIGFGELLLKNVMPSLIDFFEDNPAPIIQKALICANGSLSENFLYLSDYAEGGI
jgi:alanine dehydrogenase